MSRCWKRELECIVREVLLDIGRPGTRVIADIGDKVGAHAVAVVVDESVRLKKIGSLDFAVFGGVKDGARCGWDDAECVGIADRHVGTTGHCEEQVTTGGTGDDNIGTADIDSGRECLCGQ